MYFNSVHFKMLPTIVCYEFHSWFQYYLCRYTCISVYRIFLIYIPRYLYTYVSFYCSTSQIACGYDSEAWPQTTEELLEVITHIQQLSESINWESWNWISESWTSHQLWCHFYWDWNPWKLKWLMIPSNTLVMRSPITLIYIMIYSFPFTFKSYSVLNVYFKWLAR